GLPPGCNCQQRCIRGIVGDCFDQCDLACKGDLDALKLCQRACRNAQCASLRANCAADNPNASVIYLGCCAQCESSGACDEDRDAEALCTPTTTTTSTTTTSTTSTSSGPTTTTFAGQTTTSSTLIPTTSTTTITIIPMVMPIF